tara:strand:- start:7722 stop:8177 length:456 start_codon:yes stop_codon:yes gene_type:complete
MYAIDINGEIKTYNELPKSWGNVIGGFNTLSDEAAESYGFYTVEIPDYNKRTHNLGSLYFDTDKFTYNVESISFSESLSKLKESTIESLREYTNYRLSSTDWYIIRNAERGIELPQNIQDERASILDDHNTRESEINALTTKASVVSYEYK